MTNTEAEAVLLALGPQLEWRHTTSVECRTVQVAKARQGHYFVHGEPGSAPPNNHFYGNEEDKTTPPGEPVKINYIRGIPGAGTERLTCKDVAAAKAACERHHATGEWE